MTAQGSQIFDTQTIDNLVKRIDGIDICRDLQDAVDSVFADLNGQIKAVEEQMAFIKPIVELLENPAAEIPKIIEWIGKFIETVLKPMYQPYLTMAEQVEAYAEAVARLTTAVTNAAARIGSCSITLPAVG